MAVRNSFLVKIGATPRGVVSVSRGMGRKSSQPSSLSCQSSQTSRTTDERIFSDFPLSDDCPPSEILRPGYGLLGNKPSMSRKSANNALERMAAIELEYGTQNVLFLTSTLPSDRPFTYESLARYSSFAVNRINQWLKDNYGKENFARVSVWEYQKRGAPHLHAALGISKEFGLHTSEDESSLIDENKLNNFRRDFAIAWMHILESIGDECDCDMFESDRQGGKERLLDYGDLGKRFANVQVVEKSVAGYLGSYLAGSNHSKNNLRRYHAPIATWAQWDRKATALFNKYSINFTESIWADKHQDWLEIREILFGSIEPVPGTKRIEASNEWWHSEIVLSDSKGLALIENVNDFIRIFKASDCVAKYFDNYSFKRKNQNAPIPSIKSSYARYRLEHELIRRSYSDAYLVPIVWDILEMYCLIDEMNDIVEAQYNQSCNQLPIDYG